MSILTINHNISALNTQRNLNATSFNLSKSLQKLSSGFRINTAADGPADLVISEGLRAQMNGLGAALRNTQEANNKVGIAEGALNEVSSLLTSMRALAVHSANKGVVTAAQVAADQAELNNAVAAINRIGQVTRFSGQTVFTAGALKFHIGEGAVASTDEVSLTIGIVTRSAIGLSNLGAIPLASALSAHANSLIGRIDVAIANVAT